MMQSSDNAIVMLPVSKIFPHPDNPRKDIGDISELTESIKANGILQNLTVVPKFASSTEEYTVIIGHRRLAAAKQAGLETVPCIIADMSIDEQITTMLVENMQRADLTVYEQAKAFQQLSFDMGMTVPEIAEMSGFSETTVRRRTKLAELDEKAFKKACDRGATLFDFAELDKIEDPAERHNVLETAGTENFKNALKKAITDQETKKQVEAFEEQVAQFATKIEKPDASMRFFRNYATWTSGEVERPKDADSVKYYYTVSKYCVSVYVEASVKAEYEIKRAEHEARQREDKANWERAKEMCRRHRQLRRDFVLNLSPTKAMTDIIVRNSAEIMLNVCIDNVYDDNPEALYKALEIGYDDESEAPVAKVFKAACSKNPLRTLLIVACWYMEKYGDYIVQAWNPEKQRYFVVYRDNQQLDSLYYFLEELGYKRSDEERQMSRGTHPIFSKEE